MVSWNGVYDGAAGGVTVVLRGQSLARVDVQPNCRAVVARRRSNNGKELLDGNDRYGKVL